MSVADRLADRGDSTPASPVAHTVHSDEAIHVADVRCPAQPPAVGVEETSATFELVFPVRGVFVRRLTGRGRGATTVGDPSSALVFRPGEPYRVAHPLGGADRSIVIVLRASAIDAIGWPVRSLPDRALTSPTADLLLRRWLRGMQRGTLDEQAGFEVAVALLDHLAGAAVPSSRADTVRAADAGRLADAVRLELAAHLGDRVTLPDLGRRVGVSPFHLARRFRAATGTTIHAWRRTLRVREALARIDAGERDLTSLALDLGFAHHSHLTNTVRAEIGRPPSAFRREVTSAEIAGIRRILQA